MFFWFSRASHDKQTPPKQNTKEEKEVRGQSDFAPPLIDVFVLCFFLSCCFSQLRPPGPFGGLETRRYLPRNTRFSNKYKLKKRPSAKKQKSAVRSVQGKTENRCSKKARTATNECVCGGFGFLSLTKPPFESCNPSAPSRAETSEPTSAAWVRDSKVSWGGRKHPTLFGGVKGSPKMLKAPFLNYKPP